MLFSLISDTSFEIESKVPESDIAKISLGDKAKITLDAYGSDVIFEGRVTAIDPAETVVDNVPTYKVTLHFMKDDSRIKSGMTANIDIATGQKTDVLVVPQRAVITKDAKKFITLSNADKTTREVLVATGLRGSDGTVEIVEGVKEGDVIVVTPKQ